MPLYYEQMNLTKEETKRLFMAFLKKYACYELVKHVLKQTYYEQTLLFLLEKDAPNVLMHLIQYYEQKYGIDKKSYMVKLLDLLWLFTFLVQIKFFDINLIRKQNYYTILTLFREYDTYSFSENERIKVIKLMNDLEIYIK